MPKMYITKLDAARRQLEMAITLFFKEKDAVSIHTLTMASFDILRAIGKGKGVKPIAHNEEFIRPERRKEYRHTIRHPHNFFKHADKDANKSLDFNSNVTEYFLFDAVEMFIWLTGESPLNIAAYHIWFFIHNPELLTTEIREKIIKKWPDILQEYKHMTKQEFYSYFVDAMAKYG